MNPQFCKLGELCIDHTVTKQAMGKQSWNILVYHVAGEIWRDGD